MKPIVPISVPIAAALALSTTACILVADDGSSDLTIHNHSDVMLTAVHVAKVGDPHWGPNLLPDPMYPREDLVVHDLECATYDVLVIDDTGMQCQLHDLALCFHDEGWVITNTTLGACAFHP